MNSIHCRYDRILQLQRGRARLDVTRTVTFFHVSRQASVEMWEMLRRGLGANVPCVVLGSFFQPDTAGATFCKLPDQTRNPACRPPILRGGSGSGGLATSVNEAGQAMTEELDREARNLRAAAAGASPLHGLVYRLQHKYGRQPVYPYCGSASAGRSDACRRSICLGIFSIYFGVIELRRTISYFCVWRRYGVPVIDETLYPNWPERSLGSLIGASLLSNSLGMLCLAVLVQNLVSVPGSLAGSFCLVDSSQLSFIILFLCWG